MVLCISCLVLTLACFLTPLLPDSISIVYDLIKEKQLEYIGKRMLRACGLIASFAYLVYLVFFQASQQNFTLQSDAGVISVFLVLDFILLAVLILSLFKSTDREIQRRAMIIKSFGILIYAVADISYLVVIV